MGLAAEETAVRGFVGGVKEATSFIVLSSWMRSAGVF